MSRHCFGRGSCPGVPLAIRSQVAPLSRLEHCRTVTFISSRAVLAVVTSQWQKASVVIPCFRHWIISSELAACLELQRYTDNESKDRQFNPSKDFTPPLSVLSLATIPYPSPELRRPYAMQPPFGRLDNRQNPCPQVSCPSNVSRLRRICRGLDCWRT